MKLERRTIATLSLILTAILFIAINLAADTFLRSARIDLTENQIHTLSEGTRRTLGKLEEPVTLKFYYSEQTATGVANISAYAARVRDLISEYVAQAGGRLHYVEIKPTPDSDEEDEATQEGIQERKIRGTDLKIYFGLVGTNTVGEKKVIPYFDEQRDQYLEYDLTAMISQLSSPQKPKLGIVSSLPLETGPGGLAAAMQGRSQPYVIYQQLQENFEIEHLEQDFDRVPESISTLMIAHPQGLAGRTLYAIDQFVMRGGRVILFVDPVSEIAQAGSDPSNPMRAMAASSSDLAPLLKAWGVAYDPSVVIADRALAPRVQYGNDSVSYVLWMQLQENQLNREDITTGDLTVVNLGTPGALRQAEGATTSFTPLMQTSDDTQEIAAEQARFVPNPEELLRTFLPTGQRNTIAARVSGPGVSAYPDGPPPEEPKPDSEAPEPASRAEEAPKPPLPAHLKEALEPINVIVVADTDIFDDRFWVQIEEFMGRRMPVRVYGDNAAFVLSAVENMMGSNDLISLRARKRVERPFTVTADLRRQAERKELSAIQKLQGELDEANRRLGELKGASNGENHGGPLLTAEQSAEVQRLEVKAAETRKELRAVRRKLRADIVRLGNLLAFVNIALMPLMLVAFALALAYRRRLRRRSPTNGRGA